MGVDPISIGLEVAGTATSIVGGVMGMNAQKEEVRARQRQQDLQAQQARLQQIRAARVQRANIVQGAASSGTGESSSAITGESGVVAKEEGNIQNIDDQQHIGQVIESAQMQQIQAKGIQSIGQGMTSVGGTIGDNKDAIQNIFGG